MKKEALLAKAISYVAESSGNRVAEELALAPELVGMRMFEAPIFGFASADDPLFLELQRPEAIGPHFKLPKEWLPGAKTVISFFLPFTDIVKQGNSRDMDWPSTEWLHARIEGQAFLTTLTRYLLGELQQAGFAAVAPPLDERFRAGDAAGGATRFTSNWSERHVAFVSGLGTFGLSKGLITRKGIAGRFGSIVTDLEFAPVVREYSGVYEYCTMCGACIRHCPPRAITLESGKDHPSCDAFLDQVRAKHRPRYGCGKCQVKVPCESGIPGRATV